MCLLAGIGLRAMWQLCTSLQGWLQDHAFIRPCLAAITKEGGIEHGRGTLGRAVLLLRPCRAWRRRQQQFIAASELFNAIFTPSSDCAPSRYLPDKQD